MGNATGQVCSVLDRGARHCTWRGCRLHNRSPTPCSKVYMGSLTGYSNMPLSSGRVAIKVFSSQCLKRKRDMPWMWFLVTPDCQSCAHWLRTPRQDDCKRFSNRRHIEIYAFSKKALTHWRQFGAIGAERHHHGQG